MGAKVRRILPRFFAALGIALAVGAMFFAVFRSIAVTHAIQVERARNVLTNCESQNRRHDATIETLDRQIEQVQRVKPELATQFRASRNFTVLLINAMAPKQDCAALVRKQVQQ
jgi:hypothetical protein